HTSSAAGLFQFVDQTWLATLKKHGAKYGYARYAELIQQSPGGRYYVNGSEARQTVMDLRLDPHAASLMAGELASDHASYLRGRVGRDPTSGELYAAHVLGGPGSAKLIEAVGATPAAPAAALFPDAASANHGLFYRDGRALSVADLYDSLTRPANPSNGRALSKPPASSLAASDGFLQYASARRLDRSAQEAALIDLVLRGPQSAGGGDGMGDLTGQVFSSDMLRVLSEAREDR
ncbi:MAG TPA: lytic transglycosylase domain-containing protein, partial [Caulobacteraceae bacterium]|nr:lytic transglycosylase domain-containing protein [Caulobacteraceae bacterium]